MIYRCAIAVRSANNTKRDPVTTRVRPSPFDLSRSLSYFESIRVLSKPSLLPRKRARAGLRNPGVIEVTDCWHRQRPTVLPNWTGGSIVIPAKSSELTPKGSIERLKGESGRGSAQERRGKKRYQLSLVHSQTRRYPKRATAVASKNARRLVTRGQVLVQWVRAASPKVDDKWGSSGWSDHPPEALWGPGHQLNTKHRQARSGGGPCDPPRRT